MEIQRVKNTTDRKVAPVGLLRMVNNQSAAKPTNGQSLSEILRKAKGGFMMHRYRSSKPS